MLKACPFGNHVDVEAMIKPVKINDSNTINHILKNHANGDDKEAVKQAYQKSTSGKGQFFKINFLEKGIKRYVHTT